MQINNRMMSLSAMLLLAASSLPLAAIERSDSCEVSLNYDVSVEPQKVVFSDKGQEQYRIENNLLYVEGKPVSLTGPQQELVREYASEIATQVPQVIELVNDAVSLASQSINRVFTPLMGDKAGTQFDTLAAGIKTRMATFAYQQGDHFYLGATETSMQNTFNQEFEQQFEALMQEAIGTMMINIGSQMLLQDGESVDANMQAFEQKIESIGQVIEQDLETQSKELEAKAQNLCGRFNQLLVLEQRLRQQVPALAPYPLNAQALSAKEE
ncbi:MAG: YggN family protein [Shewanella sp.]